MNNDKILNLLNQLEKDKWIDETEFLGYDCTLKQKDIAVIFNLYTDETVLLINDCWFITKDGIYDNNKLIGKQMNYFNHGLFIETINGIFNKKQKIGFMWHGERLK